MPCWKEVVAATILSAVMFSPMLGMNPAVATYLSMSIFANFYAAGWFDAEED